MTDVVLIASSLDEGSSRIVSAGAALARCLDADIAAVHSLESEPGQPRYGGLPSLDALLQEKEAKLRVELKDAGIRRREIVELRVTTGPAEKVISDAIRRNGASIAVLGAIRGGRKLIGSTVDRLMNRAPCVLFVVKGDAPVPPTRVLAPVDLSELSADSVRIGLDLMSRLTREPWELRILYVEKGEDVDEKTRRAELETFTASACECEQAEIATVVRTGRVAETIVEEARGWPADLVVLGTHGHGGFDRLRAGSVASEVTRHSSSSVFLVPPSVSFGRAMERAVVEQTHPERFRRD